MRNKKGFTFIELVYCLMAFCFLILLMYGVLNSETKRNTQEFNEINMNKEAMFLNNKISELINQNYNLHVADGAVISDTVDGSIYLLDYSSNKNRGLLNLMGLKPNYCIKDSKGNVIADNITFFDVSSIGDGLIQIAYTVQLKGETKEIKEIYFLNKIRI